MWLGGLCGLVCSAFVRKFTDILWFGEYSLAVSSDRNH